MQLVYLDGGSARELDVRIERPDASVADLAAAVGAPATDLYIDGRLTAGDVGLAESGLVSGSLVGPAGTGAAAPATTGALPGASAAGGAVGGAMVVARVVGGLSAGLSVPLAPGSAVVGRGGGAAVIVDDPAVSREHCRLDISPAGQVTVTDLGSRNGTDLGGKRLTQPTALGPDDILSLSGAALLRVLPVSRIGPAVPVDPIRESRPGGTIPFTRAPRAAQPASNEPVALPAKPVRRRGTTFSVSMLVAPLVMAAVTIVVMKDPRYAAFAGLTPIMFLGNVIESRTRGRLSMRRGVRDFTAQVGQLRQVLASRRTEEIRNRLAGYPDAAEILYRAEAPGIHLWERRPGAEDFMELSAGAATLRWMPPVRGGEGAEIAPEVSALLEETGMLPSVPVPVSLSDRGVIGIQGDRSAALAVARSLLCQAAVTSGPADVTVAVFTDAGRAADWDWTKWLPHTRDRRGGGSSRLLASGPDAVDTLATALLEAGPAVAQSQAPSSQRAAGPASGDAGPLLFVVVDGAALLEGRPCPLRELLAGRAGPTAGMVHTGRLPALCTLTMDVAADGTAQLRRLTLGETVDSTLAAGMAEQEARRCARLLARFEDPELQVQGAGLPDSVTLLPLLGMPEPSAEAVAARWRAGTDTLRTTAVLGVTEQDVLRLDLDDDGPHGLIAGTTGSGKSELLRTLVASLATCSDPEHLTFVLIDYKGGGALGPCARLPHCVGLVTDLDDQLSARALRCLEAELKYRERLLVQAGLPRDRTHIRDYQRLRQQHRPDLEPMPRLAVVIDEFASLVRELPGFVDKLVGIAERGRSLGVHLIMATQRPAGAVSDAIKNNVKLRIALRLESVSDSKDVIDSPGAASIGGRQSGRAFYRVSAREVLPFQTALSTGVSADLTARGPVSVRPLGFQPAAAAPAGMPGGDGQPTDLQRLVAAARDAFTTMDMPAPRRPWPEPLPDRILASELPETAVRGLQTPARGFPTLALADDPDRQGQYPVGWDPGVGNLLIYGVVGSGTSTALATLALGLAGQRAPDKLHLYALDLGAGDLAPLTVLPHTGAHVGVAEPERQKRLVRLLRRELDIRKSAGAGGRPAWMVLVDNLGAFLAEHGKDAAGLRLSDDLHRVYADGPAVGIHVAASADRPGAIPGAWASLTQQKMLLRLASEQDYGLFSVPRSSVPSFVPGRGVVAATAQVVQIAWHGGDLAAAVGKTAARWAGSARTAAPVEVLPPRVTLSSLRTRARTSEEPWWIPIGLGDTALEPAGLTLYEREHALIAGPPRSGRSLALCTVAEALSEADNPPVLVGYLPRRSPLREAPRMGVVTCYDGLAEEVDAAVAAGRASGQGAAVLIDDADTVEDKQGVIAQLLASPPPGVHVVAAGRADVMRRGFGHWTQKARDSRCGVLLIPDHDLDGPLLGVTFPRFDRMFPAPGRGYLAVSGAVEGIQVAIPAAGR